MSPLILPLQPVRQLYSFSPASGAGAEPEGQVFVVIGRRCATIGCRCINIPSPTFLLAHIYTWKVKL